MTTAPAYTDADRRSITRFGRCRRTSPGDVLCRPGDDCTGLLIAVGGAVEVRRGDAGGPLVSRSPGTGDPVLISGPSPFTTVAAGPGHLLRLTPAGFEKLSRADPVLADRLLLGLLVRRRDLAVRRRLEIVGSAGSLLSTALQAYVERRRLAHDWLDAAHVTGRALMLSAWLEPDDLPAVFTLGRAHRRVTPRTLSMLLGLNDAHLI